jgi:preflagellin peptidase FlaK
MGEAKMIVIAKILLCLAFLSYASYRDIKERRVGNRVWLIMLAAFSPFIIYELATSSSPVTYLIQMAVSFGLIFVFSYVLFYLGAFGGADAKLLMVMSIVFPFYPAFTMGGTYFPTEGIPIMNFFTFTVFGNSILLTIIVPLGLFIYNLSRPDVKTTLKKPYFMFIGYRAPIGKLENRHVKLMQQYEKDKNGIIRTYFRRNGKEIDRETLEELKAYSKKGIIDNMVWVTPGLPFIVPITAGFLAAVFYGDLVFKLTLYFMA